jgi:competence protein ComEC
MTPQPFTALVNSLLPEPHASLLNGILFGIPLRADPLFYSQLQRVGLLHLVVLSGMNITIVGNAAGAFFAFLPKRISLLLSIVSIILFTVFVGPQPPIIRAAIMGSLSLIATFLGKRATAIIGLLTATVLIAIFVPEWIVGISYQLSAGATLGIILFAQKATKQPVTPGSKLLGFIKDELQTTLAASVFTVPLIFVYFRQISFIAPVANLLVSWIVVPLMAMGTLMVTLASISHMLGIIPTLFCYGLLTYMTHVISLLSRIPFAFIQF